MSDFQNNPLAAIYEKLAIIENTIDNYFQNKEKEIIEPIPLGLLTREEVAQRLRCHPDTVSSWAANGALKAYQIGREMRFEASDVESFKRPYIPSKRQKKSQKQWAS